MQKFLGAFALSMLMLPAVGSAKGCIKGAFVGAVVGHYARHHALVGAAAGCIIEHHRESGRNRKAAAQPEQPAEAQRPVTAPPAMGPRAAPERPLPSPLI